MCDTVYVHACVCPISMHCPCICLFMHVRIINSSKLRAVELTGDKEELTTEFKAKVARSCTTGVHELRLYCEATGTCSCKTWTTKDL